MKESTGRILIIGVIAAVGLFMLSSKNGQAGEPRLISVVGEAEVKVVPDQIVFCVGAGTRNKVLQTAREENDRIVKKVMQVAKRFNIEAKDIMTNYLNVAPYYTDRHDRGTPVINGYNVYKQISITLIRVDRFEEFLCELLNTGINYVYHIQFRTTKLNEYREQARSLALQAAAHKASAMAEQLGQKSGRPYSISEWQPERNRLNRDSYLLTNMTVNANSRNTAEMAATALGQITVKETVLVSFELE